jgi:hypothetical protein
MGEGANLSDAGGDDVTLGAPCRLICGGAAGRFAPVATALPPAWRGAEVRREIRVDELKKLIYGGEAELAALLRSCGVPEEHAGEVRRRLRELIREEVRRRKLPEEEWLIDALYRILIRMAYVDEEGRWP